MRSEAVALAALAVACTKLSGGIDPSPAPASAPPPASFTAVAPAPSATPSPGARAICGAGKHMRVHFYDVGEALSALVDLPDGRHVLVDTGDGAHRAGCGESCGAADRHLMQRLRADLGGAPIDLLWITHQHADHIGGAPEVLDAFRTTLYVDNGRDASKGEVQRAHAAADRRGTAVVIVGPDHAEMPIPGSTDLRMTPIVPAVWPASCRYDPNECSIALRIDFCSSSVLFTGDTEHDEEAALDTRGPVTLLQIAHHGSETSTTPGFLGRARPKYAVISAGRPGEGYNRSFCHPRATIVKRLTQVLAGSPAKSLEAFDGERCDRSIPSDWADVPTSESLWATERDGDVVLTTTGNGAFHREAP